MPVAISRFKMLKRTVERSPGIPPQRAQRGGDVLLRGVRRLRVLLAAVRDDQGAAERVHAEGRRRRGNIKH